jgi:competence protein ComEC
MHFMKNLVLFFCALLMGSAPLLALEPVAGAVFVRVLDVGPALCCVIKSPDGHFMIYDAGSAGGSTPKMKEVIPQGSTVDLLVLSHNDDDHISNVQNICTAYNVKQVLHTGMPRGPSWQTAMTAISNEVVTAGCIDLNLGNTDVPFGTVFNIGQVKVTMICGFHQPLPEWHLTDNAEKNNSVSIVMRLDYAGKSILFCGDAVGRHGDDTNPDALIATEKFIVEHTNTLPVRAQVMIAPHHGGNNGSSTAFVNAVHPKYVIFSCGHKYHHPTGDAVQRYLAAGVWQREIYRTDFGDNEGPPEWLDGQTTGLPDKANDDSVDILIRKTGSVRVAYSLRHKRKKQP